MKKEISLLTAIIVSSLLIVFSCTSDDVDQVTLSTSVNPMEGGTVSPSEGTFNSGEEVTLTALPSQGYTFKNWLGGISGTTNPVTFTILSDKDIVAVFEKQD